jgi:hypothetical protein
VVLCAVLLVCAGASAQPVFADEPKVASPELEAIRVRLQEWQDRFSTLRLVVWSSDRDGFRQMFPEEDPDRPLVGYSGGRYEFVWTDWGAFRFVSDNYKKGKVVGRERHGSDGRRVFSAMTNLGDPDRWSLVSAGPPIRSDPRASLYSVLGTQGLWFCSRGRWLAELWDQVELLEPRSRGEQSLPMIRYANSGFRVEISIDPQTGLPSAWKDEYWKDETQEWQSFGHGETKEFREFAPGWWFPYRGVEDYGPGHVLEWEMLEVAINEPFTRQDFRPPERQPTTALRGTLRKANVAASNAGKSASAAESPLRADANENNWLSRWIPGLVIGSLAAILWGWRQKRRSPTSS